MPYSVNETFIKSVMRECPCSCTVCFWGRHVRVYADNQAFIDRFAGVYYRFIVSDTHTADSSFCIVCGSSLRPGPFLLANTVLYDIPDTPGFEDYAELIIFHHVFEHIDDYLVVHAGVLTRQGRAIVLYGQSGFGKTTLTLELLSRGYGFMSDEYCPLRIADCMVEPFERLVGMRKSSPFYTMLETQRCSCLASGGKAHVDCADLFPYSPAQPSPPGIFIEIAGDIDSTVCPSGRLVIDIYVCRDTSSVPDALGHMSKVAVSGPIRHWHCDVYRVTASDRTGFVSNFNRIWQDNSNDILGVFPYKGEIRSYERTPKLRPVPAVQALTSLGSHIVNRAPNGRLMASLGGKISSLIMLLGKLLQNTEFYSLQPGQLAKTADIIDNLQ